MSWSLMGDKGLNNSPCQYQRKCIENSMENVDTDIRL